MINGLTVCTLAALALVPQRPAARAESRPESRAAARSTRVELLREVRTYGEALVTERKLVGVSIALFAKGKVFYAAGHGFADREKRVRAGERTMYRWASISKSLTAVAAMQLVEKGKLDLDRDVRTHVPEFPDKGVPVTARQLLAHLGGIVHYRNGEVIRTVRKYESTHPFEDMILALDTFKESPLVAEPGTRYSYTTHGFILLGAVVKRAGGKKFADQVAERIAKPLGMTTLQPDYQWRDIPRSAVGYRKRGGEIRRSTDTDVSWKLPGGGFISTVVDLARFGRGLLVGELLEPETRRRMWTRQKTKAGKEVAYGLGFAIGELDGTKTVAHGGSQEKVRSFLLLLPELDCGVALMTNSEWARVRGIAQDLARMLVKTL